MKVRSFSKVLTQGKYGMFIFSLISETTERIGSQISTEKLATLVLKTRPSIIAL